VIKYIQKKCIGCRICEVVCSLEHCDEMIPSKSRIKYLDNWPEVGRVDFCRQCKKQACMEACSEDALFLTEDGLVQINRDLCTKCLACSEACPFGSLPLENQFPQYCDICKGKYECVTWCPAKALIKVGEKNG
jgi:anaerobic carbon-monoxide dehydrogenase iron sulfur subunit